jgi:beta-glucosidase
MPDRTPRTPGFPAGFLWGASTSSYQIEGSPLADGAGMSVWHRFAHTPGRIAAGDTGDVACDHYRRWREDVALMRELGLTAYRFSIAWGRVLPAGRGRVNPPGLDFYGRLVDALLEAGITPMVTLFHWDLPAALDDRGGWLNPDIAGWFADYATVMVRTLGDRVPLWATLNEPWVVVNGGYLGTTLAPGHGNLYEAPIAAHHLLRAHGAAVQAFRAAGRGRIGLVVNLEPKEPASAAAEDAAAAARSDAEMNRCFLDAVFRRHYPEELPAMYGTAWPAFPDEDFALIGEPIDWLGINYYKRGVMRHDPGAPVTRARPEHVEGATYSNLGWEVHAPSLTRALTWVRDRYGAIPLYVTENGMACAEPSESPEGGIEDAARIAYLADHLRAVRAAIDAGVDVRGYFVWSLLDNFEWAHGRSKRFGLVHVDDATQRRTPKASARYYTNVIRTHGSGLPAEPARSV